MRALVPIALGLALSLLGCMRPSDVGHFGRNAFYHAADHYRIRYADAEGTMLPAPWRIENFVVEGERPTVSRTEPIWYTSVGSGRALQRVPIFDLRYVHDDGSTIFVRTVPVPASFAGLEPTLLLGEHVRRTAIGAAARETFGFPVPRPFRWRWLRQGSATVDGRDAAHATVEVLGGRDPAGVRVTLVALQPGRHVMRVGRERVPIILVFGLASPAARHEAHLPTLERFVSRVDIAR